MRVAAVSPEQLAQALRRANPLYIPRNYWVEAAIDAAVAANDLQPFERLLGVLAHPFDEQSDAAEYALPAPADYTTGYQTFCGT